MHKILEFLSIDSDTPTRKLTILLVAAAILFGIALRMIWVWQFSDAEQFHWLGELMINTNDGYYWAEGARDLLENPANPDSASPTIRSVSILTFVFAKIFGFLSFETIIFYMPAVLGSLLALPLVLIGRSMKHTAMGFSAALIGVIAWSYYNRTMVGYYDDDMLQIVCPTLVLWALVSGICTRQNRYLLLTAILVPFSIWYYGNTQLIIFGMAGVLVVYTLVFHLKESYNYKLIGFLMLGVTGHQAYWFVYYIVRSTDFATNQLYGYLLYAIFALALFWFFGYRKESNDKRIAIAFAVIAALLALCFSNIFTHFWHQFSGYVMRAASVATESNGTTLNFFSVTQTVREAGGIDFETLANRISGHTVAFIFAIIGTIAMMIRHKALLLALPLVLMGVMAYGVPFLGISGGGLRFTIYAVPVFALGLAYFIFWVARYVEELLKGYTKRGKIAGYAVAALLTLGALAPNIVHIIEYRMPTVFYAAEVSALDHLKQRINTREDYGISWWDYGYPIRYYGYAKTLADGGKHDGASNFPVSYILGTPNQLAAARMSRLAVEYTEDKQVHFNDHYKAAEGDPEKQKKMAAEYYTPIFSHMLNDYNESDPNQFLRTLEQSGDFKLPEKTREIYLVLPLRMADIYQTVLAFANRDLVSGRQYPQPTFLSIRGYTERGDEVLLSNGMRFDKRRAMLLNGTQEIPIKYIVPAGFDNEGRYVSNPQTAHENSPYSLIFLAQLNQVWLVDDKMLQSTFVRMFALQNFDPALYEPIYISPLVKIYRVLI
ncbi:undecaprenyl-diphosphooligosaccharide--protein glycotransferase [Campylobacterota bacterium]|nr:undecaprenyl-diphosphooligosaccharide--protein glycotransferase [Campylobacterota bacterium]